MSSWHSYILEKTLCKKLTVKKHLGMVLLEWFFMHFKKLTLSYQYYQDFLQGLFLQPTLLIRLRFI